MNNLQRTRTQEEQAFIDWFELALDFSLFDEISCENLKRYNELTEETE